MRQRLFLYTHLTPIIYDVWNDFTSQKGLNGYEIDDRGYSPITHDDQMKIKENDWSAMNSHDSHCT